MIGRALLALTIKPKTMADQERLVRGVGTLMTEDPKMSATIDTSTGEAVIGGMSEIHLGAIVDRLRRNFNLEASVGRLKVVYAETVTCAADGEGRYVRHGQGRGQYAHARIHLFPGKPGSGYVFENETRGGAIPPQFIKAIDDGIAQALTGGVLAGYPVDDVHIVLYDGSYHDMDSSESSFKIAGAMAFRDAATKAKPVLLEPVMQVKVTASKEYVAAVMTDLSTRRAEVLSQDDWGGVQRIAAHVPLSEMFGYPARGGVTFVMELAGYRPFDPGEHHDGDCDSVVGAPRKPRPTLRNSSVALPEPLEDDRPD